MSEGGIVRGGSWLRRHSGKVASLAILLIGGVSAVYVILVKGKELSLRSLHLNYVYIAVAFLLHSMAILLTATAWHTLVQSVGVRIGFRTNLRLYALSCLSRNIPGFIWVFASRSLLYREGNVSPTVTVAIMALESALLSLTGFAVAAMTLVPSANELVQYLPSAGLVPVLAVATLLVLIAVFLAARRVLQRHALSSGEAYVPTLDVKGLFVSVLWMFLAWVSGGIVLFTMARAFAPIDWSLIPVFIGIWGLSGAVSLTIGALVQGFGLREIAMGTLLSTVLPSPLAVVLTIVFRLLLTLGDVVWGPFFAWTAKKLIPASHSGTVTEPAHD